MAISIRKSMLQHRGLLKIVGNQVRGSGLVDWRIGAQSGAIAIKSMPPPGLMRTLSPLGIFCIDVVVFIISFIKTTGQTGHLHGRLACDSYVP